MAATVVSYPPSGDRLLQSEMQVLTALIRGNMKRLEHRQHPVVPVLNPPPFPYPPRSIATRSTPTDRVSRQAFIYSLAAPKARVLQGHVARGKLHVRRTDWMDCCHLDEAKVKLMWQWLLCKPAGITPKRHRPAEQRLAPLEPP